MNATVDRPTAEQLCLVMLDACIRWGRRARSVCVVGNHLASRDSRRQRDTALAMIERVERRACVRARTESTREAAAPADRVPAATARPEQTIECARARLSELLFLRYFEHRVLKTTETVLICGPIL